MDPLEGYPVGFEDVAELLEDLRQAGYNVGLGQHLAARRLLLSLAARGELPEDPARLRTLLGPLLASTPAEQEEFQRRFDQWLASCLRTRAEGPGPPTAARSSFLRRHRVLLQALGLLLLLGVTLAATLAGLRSLDWGAGGGPGARSPVPIPSPRVAASPGPGASPAATAPPLPTRPPAVAAPEPSELEVSPGRVLLALLALAVLARVGHRWWWRRRARDFLDRRATAEMPDLARLQVKAAGEALFDPAALNRSSQVLRAHERVLTDRLDIPRTVEQSVRSGGLFTPAFLLRPRLPEYLALVERAAFPDHQARLAEALVDSLRRRGLNVELCHFQRDPRHCRAEGEKGAWLNLAELAALHPHHRMWIFADGDALLDPLTGRCPAWVERLEAWPIRALFTPVPRGNWGWREQTLRGAGFRVLPMDEGGLARSLDLETLPEPEPTGGLAPLLPQALVASPERWTVGGAPPLEDLLKLFGDLRYYLGDDGFEWLAATAMFPELRWELTLLLGRQLQPDGRLLRAGRVAALARLPWFRLGRQPDWLRGELLAELEPERRELVQAALEQALLATLEGPVEGLDLQVSARVHDLWREVLRRLQQQGLEGPLADSLFLSATASSAAFRLPARVGQWLRRRFAEVSRDSRLELPPPRTVPTLVASGLVWGLACGYAACLFHPVLGLAGLCAWFVASKVSHDVNPGPRGLLRATLERAALVLGFALAAWPLALSSRDLEGLVRMRSEASLSLVADVWVRALSTRLEALARGLPMDGSPAWTLLAWTAPATVPVLLWWVSWRLLLFLRRKGHLHFVEVLLPGERLRSGGEAP